MAHDIHDAFFKDTFSHPEHAAGELRHVLPANIAARIDFASLTLNPGSFVDEAFSHHHTDLLFSAPLAGRPAFIYLLFEHKSVPETLTAFQLLRYKVEIWKGFLEEHPQTKRLPAILPVVVHHGEDGWTCPKSFEELSPAGST